MDNEEPQHVPKRLLRLPEVLAMCSISRAAAYALIKRHEFRKPVRVGHRASRWREEEIASWIDELPPATEQNFS